MKQNETIDRQTPLSYTLAHDVKSRKTADPTTVYRYILEDATSAECCIFYDWEHMPFYWCTSTTTLLFYQQSVNVFLPDDACALRAHVIWDAWLRLLHVVDAALPIDEEYLSFDLNTETLKILKHKKSPLLSLMFDECVNSYDSFVVGGIFLKWISNSDIDVEKFISHEVETANASDSMSNRSKRFVFEPCGDGEWRLALRTAEYEVKRRTHQRDDGCPVVPPQARVGGEARVQS